MLWDLRCTVTSRVVAATARVGMKSASSARNLRILAKMAKIAKKVL